jgi:hypothetical protein
MWKLDTSPLATAGSRRPGVGGSRYLHMEDTLANMANGYEIPLHRNNLKINKKCIVLNTYTDGMVMLVAVWYSSTVPETNINLIFRWWMKLTYCMY